MHLRTWQRRGLLAVVGTLAFLVLSGTLISSIQWIRKPFPGFFLYGNLSVAPDFLPHWSGRREGLRFLDRLSSIQGQPINRPETLYDWVRRYPPGSNFDYTFERNGKPIHVTIASMNFSFQDWLLTFGIYLVVGLGFLAIGVTPFYLRSPSPAAAPLFLMVSSIFFWFACTYDFVATETLPKQARIFAFVLTPGAGVHLGLCFTGIPRGRARRRLCLCLVYGLSTLLGLFYVVSFGGPFELWHLAMRLAYGYSCFAAIVFLGLLWVALKGPISELERSRLRVVGVGAVAGFFLPTFGTVLTSFSVWEIPYNLLLIPTVFFPLSVAYALLKYNLFDLGAVLKVGISRGALTGALLLIYILVVSILSFSAGIYETDPWVPLLFSVLVVLVFNPLLRWIETVVDRTLDPKEYDPIALQSEVSLLLRSLSKAQPTAEKFLQLVAAKIGIDTAFLFFQPDEQGGGLLASVGGDHGQIRDLSQNLTGLWARHLGKRKAGISKDELEMDPAYHESRGNLLASFRILRSEILIPVVFQEKILGFLSVGKKRSGRGYSADDFQLLCTLADQLALSLKNGMLFEESEAAKESYQVLYDQAQVLNRKLIEVDQLKKQFVANVSHEIRTPLSTILGYAEVLLEPGFAGDRQMILERVVSSGEELSRLMDTLLDFSRMETGSMTTSLQKVNVPDIFEALETMARRLIKKRPIEFRVGINHPETVIETDSKKFQQILMQLLTNAVKFTERGEIALEINPLPEGGHDFVEISVSDTGIGISERDQEIIFDEFRQLDGSSTRQYGGTGLGLSLCRKLAQSLGGMIEVESEPGKGSIFSLILPLRRPNIDGAAVWQGA
ncbi:MAG: GAF domain-containing protein [Deltaproteobacteria bacterium]|nr:GAF domain-containing protein [Deltaproteobacteria bacterium]